MKKERVSASKKTKTETITKAKNVLYTQKSSLHSSHNNSKTLELLNESAVVDFTIDEILTELGNESEIHKGGILLFPPTGKEGISPSHLNAPFKSSSLISHENEQEQRREKISTTKDLSEGFGRLKSVISKSPENSRLPRSFKDRASHTNKPDKSSNDKVPASCNHYHLKPLCSKRSTHQ